MSIFILSIFRSKLKTILSVLLFTVIFVVLLFTINTYCINLEKIKEIEAEVYTVIYVDVEDGEILEKIGTLNYIDHIDDREIITSVHSLTIQAISEDKVDEIVIKLKNMGLEPTTHEIAPSELTLYRDADNFQRLLIGIVILSIVILLVIELKLQVSWECKNILFLKILGYSNFMIALIVLARIYIPVLISILLSITTFTMVILIDIGSLRMFLYITPLIFGSIMFVFLFLMLLSKVKKLKLTTSGL